MNAVRPRNNTSSARCNRASVIVSIALVASSSTTMRGFASSARAKQTSCRCPNESDAPFSENLCCNNFRPAARQANPGNPTPAMLRAHRPSARLRPRRTGYCRATLPEKQKIILLHTPHLPGAQRIARHLAQIHLPIDQHAPRPRQIKFLEQPHQRRFPAPRVSHQRHRLSRLRLQTKYPPAPAALFCMQNPRLPQIPRAPSMAGRVSPWPRHHVASRFLVESIRNLTAPPPPSPLTPG